ncbi:hypothetical protein SmJEL517_g03580 [Synchytrium microbalum]|uniref:Kinesin motor domain-containing protein n=1 Tax=Synchytrium microbalum TaxID=1806994 RepID=A0A507C7X9_9FUNG|nr:uncharacterized protein SmJEL517_g03580 [Synchytrium microbalum]TPX33605.1 hypothetical protein SmJEL517_g03580 [Synchytrium microbalum]
MLHRQSASNSAESISSTSDGISPKLAKVLSKKNEFLTIIGHHNATSATTPSQPYSESNERERDVTICLRTRPLLPHEQWSIHSVKMANPKCTVFSIDEKFDGRMLLKPNESSYDMTFGEDVGNSEIHAVTTRELLRTVYGGASATLFAYGQTGSGKTYTLNGIEECVGNELFEMAKAYRQRTTPNVPIPDDADFDIFISFFELFGNRGFDLLNERSETVQIMEDVFGTIQVKGTTEVQVSAPEQVHERVRIATSYRRTETTFKNTTSSRSHAVCRFRIVDKRRPSAEPGILMLIDLAGSENTADAMYHDKSRVAETKELNKSLAAIKECIRTRSLALTSDKMVHIPYRTTRLTLLLKDTFDLTVPRPCKTIVIAHLSPSIVDTPQSLMTVRFAAPLRIIASKRDDMASNSEVENPATWTNQQLRDWFSRDLIGAKLDLELFCPYETGMQMCRLSEGEFVARVDECATERNAMGESRISQIEASKFYIRLWRKLIEARTKVRKEKLKYRPNAKQQKERDLEYLRMYGEQMKQ